jgi:hypothetical protein
MIRFALPEWTYPSKPIEDFIPDGFAGARNTPIFAELISAIAAIRAAALKFSDFRLIDWDLTNPEFVHAWARDIHPVFLVVTWRDKDNRSGYHTRILWVPKDVRDELASYQALLLRICRKLGLPAKWRRVPGFFIDVQRLKPELIQPRSIVEHLDDVYPWVANSHRRTARQWLRGRVSPSIAYVFMGHWSSEQEPWRLCSGRSLRSICKTLESQIPELLGELGLNPLPWEGLTHGK